MILTNLDLIADMLTSLVFWGTVLGLVLGCVVVKVVISKDNDD